MRSADTLGQNASSFFKSARVATLQQAKDNRRARVQPCKAFVKEDVELMSGRRQTSQILVVAGDVKEGSTVSCEGDICVLGRLYGKAHAGNKGDSTALIKALQICTDQIQIANRVVGEFVECDNPTTLSCNSTGYLEMRVQASELEGSSMMDPCALVTLSDEEASQSSEAWANSGSDEEVVAAPEESQHVTSTEHVTSPNPPSTDAADPAHEITEPVQLVDQPPSVAPEAGDLKPSIAATQHDLAEGQQVAHSLVKPSSKPNGLKKGVKKKQPFTWSNVKDAGPVAKLALFTGCYIAFVGAALLFAPVSTFTLLFDWRSVAPVWIRIGGVLAMLFGFYYVGAAHGEITRRGLRSFYEATVYGRIFLFVAFMALVALKKSQWQLVVLAMINLLGALSMRRALMTS